MVIFWFLFYLIYFLFCEFDLLNAMWYMDVGELPQYYHRCYFYEDSMLMWQLVRPSFKLTVFSYYRGMIVTSGKVVIKKDTTNLIGISIGGGAPYCPCLYIVQVILRIILVKPSVDILQFLFLGIWWDTSCKRRNITKWRWTSRSQWSVGEGKN